MGAPGPNARCFVERLGPDSGHRSAIRRQTCRIICRMKLWSMTSDKRPGRGNALSNPSTKELM